MRDPNAPPALPDEVPADRPSVARMYDYFLSGTSHFAIDRQAAGHVTALAPDTPRRARANRAFLRRAVRFLLDRGIDQFLDLGAGLPTAGNVHEIAQQDNPAARVVYVDRDPIAVAYGRRLLRGNHHATSVLADVRDAAPTLAHPDVRGLLDFARPVGLLLIAVLHFVGDDAEAYGVVATLRAALAPGSYLALSHVTAEGLPPAVVARGRDLYARTSDPVTPRSLAQLEPFLAGLELVAPGLVYAPMWRPETSTDLFFAEPARSQILAGVARKP